ncbi:hypothetical protein A2U01_0117782, partial [Trifolium medium]|nr:hypothetical protein [Trifolium medium]
EFMNGDCGCFSGGSGGFSGGACGDKIEGNCVDGGFGHREVDKESRCVDDGDA